MSSSLIMSQGNLLTTKTNSVTSIRGTAPRCCVCLKPCSLKCQRCGTDYCSQECHAKDWPSHKTPCLDFTKLGKRHSPQHNWIRYLRFPSSADKAEWGYMHRYEEAISLENTPSWVPALMESAYYTFEHHPWSAIEETGIALMVLTPGRFGGPNCDPINPRHTTINKSLARLGKLGQMYPWSCDACVIAYRLNKIGNETRMTFEDVEMKYYRSITTWFLTMEKNPCIDPERYPAEKLPAIKLTSSGDCFKYKISSCEMVHVVPRPGFFDFQWPSPLAWIVGLPWICRLSAHSEELLVANGTKR
jgi:hypothetical protein